MKYFLVSLFIFFNLQAGSNIRWVNKSGVMGKQIKLESQVIENETRFTLTVPEKDRKFDLLKIQVKCVLSKDKIFSFEFYKGNTITFQIPTALIDKTEIAVKYDGTYRIEQTVYEEDENGEPVEKKIVAYGAVGCPPSFYFKLKDFINDKKEEKKE